MELDHWEAIGRKEYEVSLRNRVYKDVRKNIFNNYEQSDNDSIEENEKSESSPGSQNFRLHLTESLLTDDSPEQDRVVKYNKSPKDKLKDSVIVISDSSGEDTPSSYLIKRNHGYKTRSSSLSSKKSSTDDGKSKKSPQNNNNNNYTKSISLDSTDEDDDDVYPSSLINSKSRTVKKVRDNNRISLLTSDESFTEKKKNNNHTLKTARLISPRTPVFNPFKKYQSSTSSNKSREKEKKQLDSSSSGGKTKSAGHSSSTDNDSSSPTKTTPRTLRKFPVNTRVDNEKKQLNTPNQLKLSECTTPLSKKDVVNIKKTIDSRRVVFDSPSNWNKNTVIPETESESDESESEFNKRKNIGHPALINDTLSDEESPKSKNKTSTPDSNPPREPSVYLSESKKNQISNWLMNAPDDVRSDDSISVVPPSTSSPAGSGNSSLERLEINYETPNNRDKFRKNLNYIESPKSKTSTIDNYLTRKKAVPPEKKNYSPLSVIKPRNVETGPAKIETKRARDFNNYDDILEKLYGKNWKAMIENKTTPRNDDKGLNVRSTGVQTDPKRKLLKSTEKKAISISSSSDDDDDEPCTPRDKGRNLKIKKKPVTVIRKPCKDSFIDDSIVGSGGETTYLTALTTPRSSDESNFKKDPPKSATTRRAIEICDSDTEDDDDDDGRRLINKKNDGNNLKNKKRLSYSDDDNTSTGTSEYDPLDVVLPRRIFKSTPKVPPKKSAQKWPSDFNKGSLKTKSFLTSLAASVPMGESHPDAKKYKLDFKNTKEELSKKLYKLYNENVFDNRLPNDMSIEWNVRMRGTAGYCYNKKTTRTIGGTTRSSRIVLSSKILDSADRLRDTLIHEMCHAASWLLNEVCDGHGPFWKAWASKAVKTFPELPPIKRCHDYKISTKFTYRCTTCGYSIGRHSKSLDIDKKRCGHCFGKFELLINRVTKSGTNIQTPKQQKEPTGFALFVKENYGTVKQKRHGVAHKEIMQILGQQFSAIKIGNKKK